MEFHVWEIISTNTWVKDRLQIMLTIAASRSVLCLDHIILLNTTYSYKSPSSLAYGLAHISHDLGNTMHCTLTCQKASLCTQRERTDEWKIEKAQAWSLVMKAKGQDKCYGNIVTLVLSWDSNTEVGKYAHVMRDDAYILLAILISPLK